ncbi:hypothetical protein RFI_33433, partial [Reticulomyxa filosa]
EDGGKEFVEIVQNKEDIVPLKYGVVSNEKEFEKEEFWKKVVNRMSDETYDSSSICHLELYSNASLTQHYLIGVTNHAHMDLRGNFSLFHSLLFYIGEILDFRDKLGGKMEHPFGF